MTPKHYISVYCDLCVFVNFYYIHAAISTLFTNHQGREKMPTYWLGAFHNPKGLLSLLKQEAIRRYSERTGNAESVVFKTEITQRDKEHVSDV